MKRIIIILLALLLIMGCTAETNEQEEINEDVDMEETGKVVVVETTKGNFSIQLYEDTPISTNNFLFLVESGFYDGLTFHRYEPGFVIQGGDPNGDGTGGSEQNIPLEVIGKSHKKGTLGMARSNDPNSASSQFFVNLNDNKFLDKDYAVFGKVIEGMDVVEQLRIEDVMNKVYLKE